MLTPEQIQERQDAMRKVFRIADYQKTKKLHDSICSQIEQLNEDVQHFKLPRNPREDSIQVHSKNTLQMLIKQKGRLIPKMEGLEKQIKEDIKSSKNEL